MPNDMNCKFSALKSVPNIWLVAILKSLNSNTEYSKPTYQEDHSYISYISYSYEFA